MTLRNLSNTFGVTFLASSSVIFAGSFVVNVLNYVFTLLISHILGVEAYTLLDKSA
jgi:hypothetical protein